MSLPFALFTSGQDWLLVLIATVIGTFWIEIRKLIFWRGNPQQ